MLDSELTQKIIGIFYDIYNETGSNFLEKVVQAAMVVALRSAGLTVAIQFRTDRPRTAHPSQSRSRLSAAP